MRVHVFDDFGQLDTPDSAFPNNWFSTHHGGRIAIYPMYAPNRRKGSAAATDPPAEEQLPGAGGHRLLGLEYDDLFLEGTGAMVFDHLERVAYVASSHRADPVILERFCTAFGYEPMAFPTAGADGRPIYHTNVLLTIATEYALVCLAAISYRSMDATSGRRPCRRNSRHGRWTPPASSSRWPTSPGPPTRNSPGDERDPLARGPR